MTDITLRPLSEADASDLAALAREVFRHEEPSRQLAEVLRSESAARAGLPTADVPGAFGLAAYRGPTLVGWTQGYRVGPQQFHMLNSGVAGTERRQGVYTQLVRAVLVHAESQAYVQVRSLHVASNSPVIIAKMRLGFFIAGFEYSEVYGPLVQLRYLVGEARRELYRVRAASLRPEPE